MANIENLDELLKKLDNLERVLDVSEPLQESCLLVENTAKQILTENGTIGTGELRNSITHQVVGDVGYIGTNLHYAPYVEYGTGLFAAGGNGRTDVPWVYCDAEGKFHSTSGQKPQPFLEPALRQSREMITKIFSIFIERELG